MKIWKNLRFGLPLLMLGSMLFWVTACQEDEPEVPDLDQPTITIDNTDIALDAGTPAEIPVLVSVPGGYASSEAIIAAGAGEITIMSEPAVGDTSGTITLQYSVNDPGQANISLTVTDQQETPKTATVTMTMTAYAPLGLEYANVMDMINTRPEFTEMAILIDRAGMTEAFQNNEVYDTFFPVVNGSFDAFLEMSPFYETLEELPEDVANSLLNLLRGRFRIRGIETAHGGNYEAFKLEDFSNPDVNRGNQMENRTYGEFAIAADGSGLGFLRNDAYVAQANFVLNDILIGDDLEDPVVVAHVIDDLWFDMSLMSEENFAAEGLNTGWRSEEIPRAMGWSNVPWWPLNGLNGKANYSGSRSNNGILIVALDAVEAINALTPTTDLEDTNEDGSRIIWGWPAGSCSEDDPTASGCPSWYPRPDECGCYVPDEDFQVGVDYWRKHSIQMTDVNTLANGPVDGTFANMLGDNITISGSTISLGSNSANVVATYHWFDDTGRFNPLPSTPEEFLTGYEALGGMYRVVYVVDTSL